MKPTRKVTLPHPSYQPTKAEKRQKFKVEVPGKTIEEQMDNFAKALMRPVEIEYSNTQNQNK